MPRYIDADALMGKYEEFILKNSGQFFVTQTAIRLPEILAIIETFPTADVAEVKRGEWKGKPIAGYSNIRCSVCNAVFLSQTGKWHYGDVRCKRI